MSLNIFSRKLPDAILECCSIRLIQTLCFRYLIVTQNKFLGKIIGFVILSRKAIKNLGRLQINVKLASNEIENEIICCKIIMLKLRKSKM